MTHRREQIAALEVHKGAMDEAVVMVATFPHQRRISLAIYSLGNGDREMYLRPQDCQRVVDYLREALARF